MSKIMRTAQTILRKMKIKSRDQKFRVGGGKVSSQLLAQVPVQVVTILDNFIPVNLKKIKTIMKEN